MSIVRSIVLTAVLSVLAAALGAWGGIRYSFAQLDRAPALHELVHDELKLSVDQEQKMAVLEQAHAIRRAVLDAEMRAANADLARSFQQQHQYTDGTQAAIDRLLKATGELQKEIITHVIAMRAVLTPDQGAKFDEVVVQALTDEAP